MPKSSLSPEAFYGKILLFGEYTLLLEGNALAIPLQNSSFKGVLKYDTQEAQNPVWKEWLNYLMVLKSAQLAELSFDWSGFEKDIAAGLKFDSTLPVGYGLGSSGALTAAVFRRYISENQWKTLRKDLNKLQKTLALFESFFHGSSSGMDPLVSLLNAPVHSKGSNTLILQKLSDESYRNWFLVDSGLPRQTSMLVESFRNELDSDPDFKEKMLELKTANHKAIQDFLELRNEELKNGIRNISSIQFTQMSWLIPENIKSMWAEGLQTGRFYFKLCGAGGGGFFLVFIPETEDQLILKESLGLIAFDITD